MKNWSLLSELNHPTSISLARDMCTMNILAYFILFGHCLSGSRGSSREEAKEPGVKMFITIRDVCLNCSVPERCDLYYFKIFNRPGP